MAIPSGCAPSSAGAMPKRNRSSSAALSKRTFKGSTAMLRQIGVSGLVLFASLSIAAAQQKASDPGQQAPANPQGDGAFKSQQGGKEEPGSHSSGVTGTQAF